MLPLLSKLAAGGGATDVAEYLMGVEVEWMGFDRRSPAVLEDVSERVVDWYESSLAGLEEVGK